MAFPSALVLLFISTTLLFFSVSVPLAQAAITDATIVPTGAILGGTILCTNTSLSEVGTYNAIPNARVDVVCGNSSTSTRVIRSVVTDLSGTYFLVFTTADTLLNDPGKCYLNVTVPPNSCVFNIPNGFLRIPIVILNIADDIVGSLLVLVPGRLTYILPF